MTFNIKKENIIWVHSISSTQIWQEDGWVEPQASFLINEVEMNDGPAQNGVCANELFETKYLVFRATLWRK